MKSFVSKMVVGLSMTGLWAVAFYGCASEPIPEPNALRTEDQPLLTACPSGSCPTGQGCCGGYCRPKVVAGSSSPRLAAMGSSTLDYACYANQPSAQIPTPAATNMLPNFSFAGYKKGGQRLPQVAQCGPEITATGIAATDTDNIKQALAKTLTGFTSCTLPYAVVLKNGTFNIIEKLTVPAQVVLRGKGQNGETVLMSQIPGQHTLVTLGGTGPVARPEIAGSAVILSTPAAVAVGDVVIKLPTPSFEIEDTIAVYRTPNQAWVNDVEDDIVTQEGVDSWTQYLSVDLKVRHYRKVVAKTATTLTLDIPLVEPIDQVYGGGRVLKVDTSTKQSTEIGLEDLTIDSDHWAEDAQAGSDGVRLSYTTNSWVRRVTVKKYGRSAVNINDSSDFNTIEEVAYIEPKSPLNAWGSDFPGLPHSGHRYPFWVSKGTGNLFQRCYSHDARHSFVAAKFVAGPNVWLDSVAESTNAEEGPHQEWDTGLLYDNILAIPSDRAVKVAKCQPDQGGWGPLPNRCGETGAPPKHDDTTEPHPYCCAYVPPGADANDYRYHAGGIRVQNSSENHGWTGAQNMFWNCERDLTSDAPPGAMNWVVGGVAAKHNGDHEYGIWQLGTTRVTPRSLYLQQLEDRPEPEVVVANVTSGAQRSGRIWDAILRWGAALRSGTGSGRLDDYYPAPTCNQASDINAGVEPRATPKLSSDGRGCCPAACGQCGGPNCGADPLGANNCCVNNILAAQPPRSCLHFPPPCAPPDPVCGHGMLDGSDLLSSAVCCKSDCPACGTSHCTDTNAPDDCCVGNITAAARSCNEFPPPCVLADAKCAVGVPNVPDPNNPTLGTCCKANCVQCGGTGCGTSPGNANDCCTGNISQSCDSNYAPCVLD